MAIQIIDQFYLNSSVPIDNRFVVGSQSFYTHRDFIEWKYVGMRVWDLNDGLPYVWDGSTYSSENSVSIGGSGTVNKIPKFTTSTTVADSNIYDDGVYVGIGNNSPAYALDVTGVIKSSSNFIGDGSLITNLDADHVTSGTLTLNRLQNSSNANYIMTSGVGGSGQSSWIAPTSITVGNSTVAVYSTYAINATNVGVNSYSVSGTSYLLFANSTGTTLLYTNTTVSPKINPSNGRIFIGSSTTGNLSRSQLRVQTSSSFSPFTTGVSDSWTNFEITQTNENAGIRLWKKLSTGASQSSGLISYGYSVPAGITVPYDELYFSGRTYINTTGTGTSDSSLITFGSIGGNNQIRFYMIGNSSTVPTVGGYGVWIDRNLYVNGTFSANSVRLINSGMDTITPQFALAVNAGTTRYVTDTGIQGASYLHAATAFDRYVSLQMGGSANTTEVRIVCAIEVGEGTGSLQTVERRKGQDGYTAVSFLVPAKCRFRIEINNDSGSQLLSDCAVASRRFGLV